MSTGIWEIYLYFLCIASFTSLLTNSDTSPPNSAISLTKEDDKKAYDSEGVRNIDSIPLLSFLFMLDI